MIRSASPALPALLLLLALAALSACGFRPLYGDASPGAGPGNVEQMAAVEVGIIADRSGHRLRTLLIQRLNPRGRPTSPAWRLEVQLAETTRDLGIREDDVATRANLTTTAQVHLVDLATQDVVLVRNLRTITSYNLLIDEFATIANERDAQERALRQIAEDIRLQIALFFDGRDPAAPPDDSPSAAETPEAPESR